MKRSLCTSRGLAVVVGCLWLLGCQNSVTSTTRSSTTAIGDEPQITVDVQGEVTNPKRVLLPERKATLKAAIRACGGYTENRNSHKQELLLFVKVQREQTDYYYSQQLLDDSVIGNMRLRDHEKIVVLPWTETGLALGLREIDNNARPKNGVRNETYQVDPNTMAPLYNIKSSQFQPRFVNFKLFVDDVQQSTDKLNVKIQIDINKRFQVPTLGAAISRRTNAYVDFALVLQRESADNSSVFVIDIPTNVENREIADAANLNPNILLLSNAAIFDGDVISILPVASLTIPRPAKK